MHLRHVLIGVAAFVPAAAILAEPQIVRPPWVLRLGHTTFGPLVNATAVSADGRQVAFVSGAQLLPQDDNAFNDVYVFDLEANTLSIETIAPDGRAANGSSASPTLSADGRYLAFASKATNLTAGPADNNGTLDVFVRDRMRGSTRCVSAALGQQTADTGSSAPAVSADGSALVFASQATNLTPGPDVNGSGYDIYHARLGTGEIRRLSVTSDEQQPAAGISYQPAISADGRFVAFASTAPLEPRTVHGVTEPSAHRPAIYVRDVTAGTTQCITCDGEFRGSRRDLDPSVSGDGRFLTFTREQTRGDSHTHSDIVLFDRVRSSTAVITEHADASSSRARISADGRYVVFESHASNLMCDRRCPPGGGDENLLPDAYLFDRETTRITRVSGARGTWWAASMAPALDGRGAIIAFASRQPFGPDDPTADFDLYICFRVCP